MKKLRLFFELFFIFIIPFFYIVSNITFKYSVADPEKVENIEFTDDLFIGDSSDPSPIYELFVILASPLKINTGSEMFKIFTSYNCLWFMNFIIYMVFYRFFNYFLTLGKKDSD